VVPFVSGKIDRKNSGRMAFVVACDLTMILKKNTSIEVLPNGRLKKCSIGTTLSNLDWERLQMEAKSLKIYKVFSKSSFIVPIISTKK
jgi:hypothetical protein